MGNYFKTKDGVNLYYEVMGEGKPLVMIHGWDQSSEAFQYNVPVLSQKYKVITVDLRGHGKSDKPSYGYRIARLSKDVYELIEYLNLKDVTLLGWSMGVSIIWSYWELFGGERLSKLIMVDEPPFLITMQDNDLGFITYSDLLPLLDAIIADPVNSIKGFVDSMLVTSEAKEKFADFFVNESMKMPKEYVSKLFLHHCAMDWRDVIPTITLPTLVIGAKKSIAKWESNELTYKLIKDSKFEVFETGHMMFLEEKNRFNDAVINFIG
ncbi:MAG: alpha/beta hydrolase [Candidatus Metalachnospira sp.]|nr:alpha/beta hydrolase [Candidatus Metalachnospira sp.]